MTLPETPKQPSQETPKYNPVPLIPVILGMVGAVTCVAMGVATHNREFLIPAFFSGAFGWVFTHGLGLFINYDYHAAIQDEAMKGPIAAGLNRTRQRQQRGQD